MKPRPWSLWVGILCSTFIFNATSFGSTIDPFGKQALAEWVRTGETLPASPRTLSKLLTDLPAAVRFARQVTGVDYSLVTLDTGEFELTTPRGLVARLRPVQLSFGHDSGLFEAVGQGTFHRLNTTFRGQYALQFRYQTPADTRMGSVGDFHVYVDVENPLLRFFALFVRGLIQERMADEIGRMLSEAKDVMVAAEDRLGHGGSL